MRWRLIVSSADDTPIYEYGPEGADGTGGIIGFPSFDIDASGNCLTMSFTAVPSIANIRPRNYVTLERYDDVLADWASWWKGVVTTAGTDRSDEPQDYQALGLKQIFYERVLNTNRWPAPPALSTDAANLPSIDDSLVITPIPGVFTDSTSAPPLGFSVGVSLPNRETIGDFLDARARLVGQFVVPPTETYTYDGVTFSEGDVVPEVRWGVDATGRFFFRRVGVNGGSTVVVDEDDPSVRLDWSPFISEGKSNSFVFVLLGGVERERLLNAQVTQSYVGPPSFDQSFVSTEQSFIPYSVVGPAVQPVDPVIEEPVNVSSPLDYMSRSTMSFAANDLWSNLGNAVNNDLTNFAQFGQTFTPINASGGTVTDVGDFRVHTFTSGGTFSVSSVGSNPSVEYLIVAGGGGGAASSSTTSGAGGGGSGGVLRGSTTITATSYSITVGAGGTGEIVATGFDSTNGGNSSGFSLTAIGGGRSNFNSNGGNGGSGGGGSSFGTAKRTGGTGTVGQGNNGGNADAAGGAGGGGAGTAAQNAAVQAATTGGLGISSSISGTAVTYAQGGNGQFVAGGGLSGAANTGNGGNGGVNVDGGAGGSGIVIIRYRLTDPAPTRAQGTPFDFANPAVITSNPVGTGAGAFVLWYSSDQPVAFAIRRSGSISGTVEVDSVPEPWEIETIAELQYEFPSTNTDTEIRPRQIVLAALAPTTVGRNTLTGDANRLYVQGVQNLRIYDCAWYQANLAIIERIAEAIARNPIEDAAGITVNNYEPVAANVLINPVSGSPVAIKVERVEYTLTIEEGVQTKFFAGQRFDAAFETERVVLTSFNRRSASESLPTSETTSTTASTTTSSASFRFRVI